jgi:hypothetical protein
MDEAKGSTRRNYAREVEQRRAAQDEPQPGDEQHTWAQQELEEMDQRMRLALLRELRGPPKQR